jgi:hypothetical protein
MWKKPPKAPEFKGAPPHARVKTYSAETGYVYQYVYRGYRRMNNDRGDEHVFAANRDRRGDFEVTIHLLDSELAECIRAIGRELIGAERYALVKMTLFAALDEFRDTSEFGKPLVPDAAAMEESLRELGRIQ